MQTRQQKPAKLSQALGVTVALLAGGALGFALGRPFWYPVGAVVGLVLGALLGAGIGYRLARWLGVALPGMLFGALFGAAGGRVVALFWEVAETADMILWGGILGALLGAIGSVPITADLRRRMGESEAPAKSPGVARRAAKAPVQETEWREPGCRGTDGSCSRGPLTRCSYCGRDFCQAHGNFEPKQSLCANCRRSIYALP